MLYRMLEVGLRPDVHVQFANTGKERNETLDFVHEIEQRWGVRVHWIEYRSVDAVPDRWCEVNYETAARRGEPFEALIDRKRYLPNPVTRFCTIELKLKPMASWRRAHGLDAGTSVVGIRADEPRRVAKMRRGNESGINGDWETVLPLAEAGVTKDDVMAFWASQPFDLQLGPDEGNCDLCFLKGINKRRRLIEDRPHSAAWWIRQEAKIGNRFRSDSASYADITERVMRQGKLTHLLKVVAEPEIDDLGDCVCTD